MAIKIRENIPEQNDILDYTNEMIDELEALKAIAGRTEEKEKEEKVVPEKKEKTSDTQKTPTPKNQPKKPAARREKGSTKKISSEEEDMDGYFKLMLYLPKDYEKKFRLIRAVTNVTVIDWIRDSVLELIDQAWEESKGQIEDEMRKMFRKD